MILNPQSWSGRGDARLNHIPHAVYRGSYILARRSLVTQTTNADLGSPDSPYIYSHSGGNI
jgi:hypothetical protein